MYFGENASIYSIMKRTRGDTENKNHRTVDKKGKLAEEYLKSYRGPFEDLFTSERKVHKWYDSNDASWRMTLYHNCTARKPIKDSYSDRTINVGDKTSIVIHSIEFGEERSQLILLDKRFCQSSIDIIESQFSMCNTKEMQRKIESTIDDLISDPYKHGDIIFFELNIPCDDDEEDDEDTSSSSCSSL